MAFLSVILLALLPVPAGSAEAKATFVSKLYGYSIVLGGSPNQWQASFARVAWSAGAVDPGLPAFDTFTQLQT